MKAGDGIIHVEFGASSQFGDVGAIKKRYGIHISTQKFGKQGGRAKFQDNMLDRRFQGSWDSLQVKKDHVDVDLVAKMVIADDFTLLIGK